MEEVRSKKGFKQIIIITVMIMICNFIVPNYAYAAETEDGGKLFVGIAQFLCFIPDVVINFLQNMFVSPQNIYNETTEEYEILYSPGTIFAGEIPAFDINFIDPMEDKKTIYKAEIYESSVEIEALKKDNYAYTEENDDIWKRFLKGMNLNLFEEVEKGTAWLGGPIGDFRTEYGYYDNNLAYIKSSSEGHEISQTNDSNSVYNVTKHLRYRDDPLETIRFWVNDDFLYMYQFYDTTWTIDNEWFLYRCELKFDENGMIKVEGEETTYKSSTSILQGIVATWYNALRRIALVGLLSVLVYLGIRIVLSSTSAKDKAKYKSMLKDWLVALCILFTLHYVMSITITVVEKINEVVRASVIGQNGEDILMSTIRTDILNGDEEWRNVIVQTVLYFVLGVYTIIFTIQYLRRVIYLAFLTMIAPLITLTYPLDKIKDKKSQAFDMWLKDYIFFSLLQVIHLLIYYVLVGSSIDLSNRGNWIFAIVAIGFLTKAEKFVKKMFGFEKSKTIGAVAAGATGALVVNAMKQIKGLGGKKGKAGGESGSGGSSNSNVRTATTNPLGAIQGSAGGSGGSGSSGGSGTRTVSSSSSSGGSAKPKRKINGSGVKAVTGKYVAPALAKGVLGAGLGLTGAMIGFAAGVAQGDLGAAVTGATIGGAAGMNLGKGAVNLPGNIEKGIKNGWNNVKDTYREGAYGEEVARAIKFDEEFRGGSTYRALQNNPNFSEESVQAMLNAGVTDKKAMTAILDSRMDVNDAIKYHTVAKNCPNEIYYNDNMLRTFWKRTMGVEEKNAERIRDVLGQFK